MDQNILADHKDIVFFLDVLLKYCVFYFGEEEGMALYNYYCDNHADIITVIKNESRSYGEKLFKLHMIFKKIETDIFFNKIDVFYVKWPYDKGEIKPVDFELFQLMCFGFYEALGEARTNKEERIKLGFARRILDLLLPPHKDCLFNHMERPNKNTTLQENLYTELKKRNRDILEEYKKNFWQLTKDEFTVYIDQRIKKTPQHLTNALWYRIKAD
jgi:hypothetical protein